MEIIVADVFVVYVYVFIYVNLSGFLLLLRGYMSRYLLSFKKGEGKNIFRMYWFQK